jgi:hypothetical protein
MASISGVPKGGRLDWGGARLAERAWLGTDVGGMGERIIGGGATGEGEGVSGLGCEKWKFGESGYQVGTCRTGRFGGL